MVALASELGTLVLAVLFCALSVALCAAIVLAVASVYRTSAAMVRRLVHRDELVARTQFDRY